MHWFRFHVALTKVESCNLSPIHYARISSWICSIVIQKQRDSQLLNREKGYQPESFPSGPPSQTHHQNDHSYSITDPLQHLQLHEDSLVVTNIDLHTIVHSSNLADHIHAVNRLQPAGSSQRGWRWRTSRSAWLRFPPCGQRPSFGPHPSEEQQRRLRRELSQLRPIMAKEKEVPTPHIKRADTIAAAVNIQFKSKKLWRKEGLLFRRAFRVATLLQQTSRKTTRQP